MANRRDVIVGGSIFAAAGLAGGYLATHIQKPRAERPIVVAGDSLGVGMAMAAGLPYVAVVGTHGTDVKAIEKQLKLVPPGHQVVMSIGTNDAHDYPNLLDKLRAAIVVYAIVLDTTPLTVLGPPVVKASWDAQAAAVDAALAGPLPLPTGAQLPRYVSLRGFDTRPWSRSADGIHFTTKGYAALWAYAIR